MEEIIYQRIKLDDYYSLNALEPYIPEEIMNNHYNGNHKSYETNLHLLLQKFPENLKTEIKEKYPELKILLWNLSQLELPSQYNEKEKKEIKTKIRFYGGGLLNHNRFFRHLAKSKEKLSKTFLEALRDSGFDSLDPWNDLKKKLIDQALDSTINGIVYGSYWTWLVIEIEKNEKTEVKKMKIIKTPNQDNPWMSNLRPLIAIDMWEHAYIQKYNFRRYKENYKKEYLEALINNCLNWEFIEEVYLEEVKFFETSEKN